MKKYEIRMMVDGFEVDQGRMDKEFGGWSYQLEGPAFKMIRAMLDKKDSAGFTGGAYVWTLTWTPDPLPIEKKNDAKQGNAPEGTVGPAY